MTARTHAKAVAMALAGTPWREPALGSSFSGGTVTAIDREELRVRIDGTLWVRFDPQTGKQR